MGCGPDFGMTCPECEGEDKDYDVCEGLGIITPERLEELEKENPTK